MRIKEIVKAILAISLTLAGMYIVALILFHPVTGYDLEKCKKSEEAFSTWIKTNNITNMIIQGCVPKRSLFWEAKPYLKIYTKNEINPKDYISCEFLDILGVTKLEFFNEMPEKVITYQTENTMHIKYKHPSRYSYINHLTCN